MVAGHTVCNRGTARHAWARPGQQPLPRARSPPPAASGAGRTGGVEVESPAAPSASPLESDGYPSSRQPVHPHRLKSTRPPLAVHWLELAETGCAGIPRARPQCARWVRPHPPAGGPSGRRGLRPWAQTLPSTCTQSVLHSLGRGPDGTPGGLLTSPAVTSPPAGRAGPTRRAAADPRLGRLGLGPGRPEQA